MTKTRKPPDYIRQGRHNRLLRELVHDPYMSKRKLPEPTVCPHCKAVFHKGRWQWGGEPEEANTEACPACRRINDRVPAGFLILSGSFFRAHQDEIVNLIRNVEQRENTEHPLKRTMDFEGTEDGMLVTFTDPHLASGVGEAIHHAYEGDLNFKYDKGEYSLRVSWSR